MAKWLYTDAPNPFTLADYQEALVESIRIISSFQDVRAIYQVGSISHPGISDIDLVIVVNDSVIGDPNFSKNLESAWRQFNYFFMHKYLVFPNSLFREILYIFPTLDFRILAGEKTPMEIPQKEEYALSTLLDILNLWWPSCGLGCLGKKHYQIGNPRIKMAVNLLLEGLPLPWSWEKFRREIPVRDTLVKMNAFRHTLSLFEQVTGIKRSKWWEVIAEISSLRDNWFKGSKGEKQKNIPRLLSRLTRVSFEMVAELDQYLCKKGYVRNIHGPDVSLAPLMVTRIGINCYLPSWSIGIAERGADLYMGKFNQPFTILPISFFWQLLSLPYIDRILVSGEKLPLNDNNDFLSSKYREVIQHRYKIMQSHNKFIEQNKLRQGAFFNYYHVTQNISPLGYWYFRFLLFTRRLLLKRRNRFVLHLNDNYASHSVW